MYRSRWRHYERVNAPTVLPPRAAIRLPPPGGTALLAVAVLAVSTSGPMIAAISAPALAVAFWRTAFATGIVTPAAFLRHRPELRSLRPRDILLGMAAGAFLAGHFAAWVPSITYTTVASSVAIVATQPVWQALLARAQGQHVPRGVWLGIGLAVLGVVLLTGADLAVSGRALAGDLLALLGGLFAAGYFEVGGALRSRLTTTTYTAICYPTSAVLLLALCVAAGQDLAGYPASAWLYLLALTLGPQMLGHSLFNVVLRTASPTLISLVVLLEVPGSALIAAVWLGQYPSLAAVPGLVLLLAGVAVVVRAGR